MNPVYRFAALGAALIVSHSAMSSAASRADWGFDASGMDRSVSPGDDFYAFVNGDWVSRTDIPADRTSFGLFANLRSEVEDRVHSILGTTPCGGASDAQTQKLCSLYGSFMDERTVEALGTTPMQAELRAIQRAHDRDVLAGIMGTGPAGFAASIFDIDLSTDSLHPDRYAIHIGQAGLGMPDRDYYISPKFPAQRDSYRSYIAQLLKLAGWPDAAERADGIVAFETRIARVSWTGQQIRDPLTTYNPVSVADLGRLAPGFAWNDFLRAAGLGSARRVVLTTNTSLPAIAAVYAQTPLDTLKAWQAFRTADKAAPYLSSAFVRARFEFRSHALAGQVADSPRWRRAVRTIDDMMGSAIGEAYVARYFTPQTEQALIAMVDNLRRAFRNDIVGSTWMSEPTRQEALRKLDRLDIQVGHPRSWIDYSTLIIAPHELYMNIERLHAFDWNRRVAQLAEPWNKSDWRFPADYPAAYTENGQLIFTAAMLQPPFFSAKADTAINYGAMGAVIGHEISHQFDDQGRFSDSNRMLRDWWGPADAQRFEAMARRLSDQYSAMEPLPGVHINGDRTLGENIADLSGLQTAFEAYHLSLDGHPAPVIDEFTGDQRFFLSWAQSWRHKQRDDSLRQMIATDVHSPAMARVNGVVRNIDQWYDAWRPTAASSMFLSPGQRVKPW